MNDLAKERKELRKQTELFHALESLKTNVAFQRLIMNGFCKDEVINLNRIASQQTSNEARDAYLIRAQAAPVLEAYLTRVAYEGQNAREKIPELDALIEQETQEENP